MKKPKAVRNTPQKDGILDERKQRPGETDREYTRRISELDVAAERVREADAAERRRLIQGAVASHSVVGRQDNHG
ncbi:MAG: hypothetical protein KBE09_02005 [Candidatus Pacebacteria bacterium]|nr:hypothetical protein [Candidatus Paceibacterota bacterium]